MDQRRHAPATERNRQPILEMLTRVLPVERTVLELASGTGQHAAYFAGRLPNLVWQPTDRDGEGFASITAWAEFEGATNLQPPFPLDATQDPWPVDRVQAIFNANMIHIAPWPVCLG